MLRIIPEFLSNNNDIRQNAELDYARLKDYRPHEVMIWSTEFVFDDLF